jgi:hypothetical protein
MPPRPEQAEENHCNCLYFNAGATKTWAAFMVHICIIECIEGKDATDPLFTHKQTNEQRNKETNKQTNKPNCTSQTNKTNKQTNKQTTVKWLEPKSNKQVKQTS